ncbi:MAG: J domain-containing protein [Acidimicrobiia bacterium]|nr:J domain-containing protein [Acidimicrobiia bacterium]
MTRAQAGPNREQVEAACELLGVREGVAREVILAAWKSAIREVHPDLASEDDRAAAEERTKTLNLAKEQLLGALDGTQHLRLPPQPVKVRSQPIRVSSPGPGRTVGVTPAGHPDAYAPQRPVPPQAPLQTRIRPQHAVRRPPPRPVTDIPAAITGEDGFDSHKGDRGTHRVLVVAIGICAVVLVLIVLGAYMFSRVSHEPSGRDIAPQTPVAPAGVVLP